MKTIAFAVLCLLPYGAWQSSPDQNHPTYVPVRTYDPSRNAQQDIEDARREAKRTSKRVLIQVGGNWASWCHIMDKFFLDHKDLADLRDANFVTVAVNVSKENQNRAALSRYPYITEYPQLIVEEADGTPLVSQKTSALEKGDTYDPEKMREFLLQWKPPDKKSVRQEDRRPGERDSSNLL